MAIQQELQLFLDAQSAGLVKGFSGDTRESLAGARDGSSDGGSSTPTSRSVQKSVSRVDKHGIVPVRQPKQKTVGLKGARKGLLRDMRELAALKGEEDRILAGEIERREEVLERVKVWESRIQGLIEQSGKVDEDGGEGEGEEAAEIAELRTEERAVQNEIREMEDRLAQMKARRNWLAERIRESVNKRDARLSSYRFALREVESEVQQFLKQPPITVSIVMGDDEGFMALPAKRRTLEMAKEWWSKEISQLQLRRSEVETEKSALEEGAKMWEESITLVMDFENSLRDAMASNETPDEEMLKKQIGKMESVIAVLTENSKSAEERKWKLLVCCIGAELEAFKAGEELLKGALQVFIGAGMDRSESDKGDKSFHTGLLELDQESTRSGSMGREDSDDEQRLAELLVEHQPDYSSSRGSIE